MQLLFLTVLTVSISRIFAAQVDLTSANRRPPIPGLPDWTQAGYEKGLKPLPGDSSVVKTITAAQLASTYGVVPNDGKDDTDGLQKAIMDNPGSDGAFTLIQLPPGTINLSYTIYLSSSYLILRGAGNDPATGTVLSFSPDSNTKYDVLTPNGANWDLDGMSFSWDFQEPSNSSSGEKEVKGDATSGWLWPGRSVFRVGSRSTAPKFTKPASLAPTNRVDFFYGTINYHWRNDTKIKGYMADQTKEIAGFAGTRKVYVDRQNSSWGVNPGSDIWIAAPVRSADYDSWQVQNKDYYQNEYMFQDWFTATNSGDDEDGHYIELDHDLAFDVYTSSIAGGSQVMGDEVYYAKVMPIDEPVHHVGIENLYMTQPMPSLSVDDAVHNYGNMAPESAMHGVVFRYARDSWVRNIRTFMTGSHPIATEAARYLQIQDNIFDGAWNKGAGGNGYIRGSRVWDSLYFNNTLRNLRHFTFQWCSMRNVAIMQNMTNDMNLHGGYEGHNLLELNFVSVPYAHRAGMCTSNCGGEGGSQEDGTWAPIYWSTGSKASKWSGATGPQNVFYRNYMLKAFTPGADQVEYQPYFSKDGSLSPIVWQFGWDRNSPRGTRYQHLSNDGGSNLLLDWQGHEQDQFMNNPNVGVNGQLTDTHTSLFLRDVSNATGVPTFSAIAGYEYCLGKVTPKVVGYYVGSAVTRQCLPWGVNGIDVTAYTHIIYAYATLAADGTISLTASQQIQVKDIVALKKNAPDLKVFIGVGGWALGMDGTGLVTIATSNSGRTKFGTTALSLLNSVGADGIDIEWAPCIGTKCISASQFSTIASAVKTGIGSKLLSLSTPNDFWFLSGVNTVTTNLANIAEFISIITHQKPTSTNQDANDPGVIQTTVAKAQSAGMPPTKLLFGIPFYSRPLGTSSLQSSCLAPSDLGQGTFPYYAVHSLENGLVYEEDSNADFNDIALDETTFIDMLTMNEGSIMFSDTPDSVAMRARLSQDLCLGGVSVFSIDQDNALSELTSAIYAPGGLLPSYDDIIAILDIHALDNKGFLQDGAYDNVASQLTSDYSFLSAADAYRMLLFAALEIQQQISNRLRSLLSEKDLSSDNFNLYQTWETKAANYQLANVTGLGNQFWHCQGDGQLIDCPGGFVSDASPFGSAFLTKYEKVEWFLDDEEGFKQYLNSTIGINLDSLVNGSFNVSRPASVCAGNPGVRRDDSVTSIRLDRRDSSDPFDPPENCHTRWVGLRLIDSATFFVNPSTIIGDFTSSTDDASTQFRSLASTTDAKQVHLISMLEATLTSIAFGNDTIGSTVAYMQEVKLDKAKQAAFDQAHARKSVGDIVTNIVLALLNFIPGVGEISDIVLGGVDTFSTISKFLDMASLAQTLSKDSAVLKLAGRGFATADDVATAARNSQEAIIGTQAFFSRAKLGQGVSKVQDNLFTCAIDTLGPFVMESFSSVAGSSAAKRSYRSYEQDHSLANFSAVYTRDDSALDFLAEAVSQEPCVFKVNRVKDIKISSKKYRGLCAQNNLPMAVPNDVKNPTSTITENYNDCVSAHKGICQCDHLLEPEEFLTLSKTKGFTDKELDAICNALGGDTTSEVRNTLNQKANLAGLFGDNKEGGSFNPDSIKSNLLDGYPDGKSLQKARNKYHVDGRKLMYEVAAKHISDYASQRQTIASQVDDLFHKWYATIQGSGDDVAKTAFKRLYTPNDDGSKRGVFLQLSKDHEANAADRIAAIEDLDDASNTSEGEGDALDDDSRKKAGKRPLSQSDLDCNKGRAKRLRGE